jgi:glycosyltransferase involved in cell wall biosynthesis
VRILLLGEFSRLHNSLKEGLVTLGHEVTIVGNGDGFKNFPVDLSTKATFCESKIGNFIRKGIYRIFKFDVAKLEFGIRFYFFLSKLEGFDVVQLINEAPIQTTPSFERFLLRKIFKNNNKTFLLCCGVDYTVANYMMDRKGSYSIMNPYFEGIENASEYQFIFEFLTPNHKKTNELVYQNIRGVIASDMDYVFPLQDHPKFLGLIPNPINTEKILFFENPISNKINIFLGINRSSYHSKGIVFFEKALEKIREKYLEKVEIQVVESVPYNDYILLYNKAHIILDQVYAFDQGYNALEAMAKGKVVFTGAEKEFEEYYSLTEKVAINALPNVDSIVEELSFLIENPNEIDTIGKRARAFVEQEHNYVKVTRNYLEKWQSK